ncbi:hypothetical protein H1R17_09980 [Flavobacterium sp. xlx-214]|uniref:IS66 family insertion sequence element accessory protein TnpA n=2 Tax=Flavobacterium TaxID=237 RepID=UPI0015EE821E|nr:hypothetical protein [Flavobacterium sp. xlx-214]QMI82795.1 hypothetical protein H1R17_09980 [Flavobacterium sp. xlx-214]
MNTNETKRASMLNLVNLWRASGRPKKEFSAANSISIHKLNYWIDLSNKQKKSNSFIEISREIPPSKTLDIIYPNGVKISTNGDFSLIKKLIHLF